MVEATFTVAVECEGFTCVRCGRPGIPEPSELRRGDDPRAPTRWRLSGWREPDNWHRLDWARPFAVGDVPAVCPDCWPDVEIRMRAFVHGLAR
jgi:hypothetical protein